MENVRRSLHDLRRFFRESENRVFQLNAFHINQFLTMNFSQNRITFREISFEKKKKNEVTFLITMLAFSIRAVFDENVKVLFNFIQLMRETRRHKIIFCSLLYFFNSSTPS